MVPIMPESAAARNPRAFLLRSRILMALFLLQIGTCRVESAETVPPPSALPSKGHVVKITDTRAVRLFMPDPSRVSRMFNAALLRFTGTKDVGTAWKMFVQSDDRVGIKVHTYPGAVMSSRHAVVETILDGLELAGISRDRMIIFDRYAPQMEAANYDPGQRSDGVTVMATVPSVGYDPKVMIDIPIPGKLIWGDYEFKRVVNDVAEDDPAGSGQISTKSYYSKILTQKVDKVINVGVPMSDPSLGLYGCQLASSLSLLDNYRRLQRPSFTREDSLVEVFSKDIIQKKVILHVLDALVAQFAGGPGFDPTYCWSPGTLYLSRDAVALDALALQGLNQRRPKAELDAITDTAAYIKTAAEGGLGEADLAKIQIVEVPVTW